MLGKLKIQAAVPPRSETHLRRTCRTMLSRTDAAAQLPAIIRHTLTAFFTSAPDSQLEAIADGALALADDVRAARARDAAGVPLS